ncbi:glycosyltransferase family 1 protein, partial [Vibrio parahaemolyticus]|uniref:glycosyltransferase n=1 Tax=Vibrio parahaemolyticus TaxID=670 RepID=UPI0017AAD697|nr:glycosyltransferase family 1 protein [Vibrio parahaemolyticus]
LVSPGNAQELAESISKLLSDKHLAERIAGSGREFVINNFDERKSADLVLQTYEEEFLNG